MKKSIPHVLIDCDPGADDFFALLWALGLHKKGIIKILALTTTGGNVGSQTTYHNALRACAFMNVSDIPVGKSDTTIKSPDASHIHGSDGLGNASKFLPKLSVPTVTFSSDKLLESCIKKDPRIQILTF